MDLKIKENDFSAILNDVQSIALLFPEEIQFLYQHAAGLSDLKGDFVDIGAFKGGSSICMALGIKQRSGREKVYTIDNFKENPMFEGPGLWGLDGTVIKEFKKNISSFGVDKIVQLICQECAEAARSWSKPVKMLFYDSSVMYEKVLEDIRLWSRFIVDNGFMIFHDYSSFPSWGGNLKKAVDDFITESKLFKLIHKFGETAVVKKLHE